MRRSIATVSLSGTLPDKLEAIAAAHFDGVEIFENDLLFYNGAPRAVARQAADMGLTIDLFQPFRDFEGVSDADHKRNLDRAERKFDLMGILGAPLMLVCSHVGPNTADDDERAAAQLYELAERAAKRNLRIGFEALSWGAHIRTYDRAYRIVQMADHPHLGIILDSFHTLALPDDWSGIRDLRGDKIFFVQLADAPRLGMSALTLSRHYRNLPGQGDLDVAGFLRATLDAGYVGTISLEIFNDDLRAAPPRQTAEDAMRSLRWLEERVRYSYEPGSAPHLPPGRPHRRRVELFDPPAPPNLTGIAFVEFAVDAESSGRLASLLEKLGFVCAGKHRSKAVSLYLQGDICLILNATQNSFAHAYYLMHGVSVCALAFTADDTLAALGRAEAFMCRRFDGRIGPHEHVFPALITDDGDLIYFVPEGESHLAALQSDFELNATAHVSNMLRRVDHIAEALPEGQLDSRVLFFRAALGLEPESAVILADPHGLVRSKAVSNAERTVRIPLNISQKKSTGTARSVQSYSGAGVHHIAFATDDIFATAKELRANAVPLLAIPRNYYDDLIARYGLAEDFVDALHEFGILYDRDGEGEFLQLFTTPFDERFFFEIVQRKGAYDFYGAGNASVRMAAQAQTRSPGATQLMW
ncbi:bifunctional sugar phosphate isomerase/epimerase/4-hydroxyphenylpyruvate dioxygenase family protein [Methylovirgula sp. 4M-Z18]|uniref:bifunctional sugar phosphate isomerase/epimerase/4-hydroxyphenylpyruvate dioxygenase family protein n=1 Tax=Methylovirgula sp. 4M-Z18 TaxID=2293567 RepID=UPI000E2FDFAC|nr:sugar phosphate isomerase/epimerase and 4-hydroxyphenylpyruvate domain-containing protein [Methylovirgula sp. 4M-Z18]RFB79459.1 sugar phosphate isomerase/epimerase and 4-hydroxyphenylpyruvate domain-containing protein [Methylovirgula sp. 4M-Z18]